MRPKATPRLLDGIDGARLVDVRPQMHDTAVVYVWTGGHIVNVYNAFGAELTCFNVGSFEDDEASREEVSEAIDEWHERGMEEIGREPDC